MNPRPQALYRQFYILSLVICFNPGHANRQAGTRRVTLRLMLRKVTLRGTIPCWFLAHRSLAALSLPKGEEVRGLALGGQSVSFVVCDYWFSS